MCEPISATIGVLTAVGGGITAIGGYQQQAAMTSRSNALAQQQYQQQLQIAAQQDQEKGRAYEAALKASTAAKNAYYAQKSQNQAEANRAITSINQELQEKRATAAFQTQNNIAKAIKAQGAVLSSGKSGQSFLLQAMDYDRTLGFEQAQIEQTLYDAGRASGLAKEGVLLDQASADMAAWNNLPADPLSPSASFSPIKPIDMPGPSKLALAGNLVSSAVSGVGAGFSTYGSVMGDNGKYKWET